MTKVRRILSLTAIALLALLLAAPASLADGGGGMNCGPGKACK